MARYLATALSLALVFGVSCAHVSGNGQRSGIPEEDNSQQRVKAPFRVIAYAMESIDEKLIQYEKLTHIYYSFLIPNSDGTFRPLRSPDKLVRIVDAAHTNNVSICISVGGWGWDAQFEAMAANPETRTAFVANLRQFVTQYRLDGVDMDWEYPDPGESSTNFLALIREVRAAIPDKILSTAVVAYGEQNGSGIPDDSFRFFDFINIMAYDGPDHGTMEQFRKGLEHWGKRGLPKSKLVIGVPFYSRVKGSPHQSVTYARLVAADAAAATTDTCEFQGATQIYNGIPTIKEKTRIAMESASGIMFWVLNADAPGDLSLLNAIHQTVQTK